MTLQKQQGSAWSLGVKISRESISTNLVSELDVRVLLLNFMALVMHLIIIKYFLNSSLTVYNKTLHK